MKKVFLFLTFCLFCSFTFVSVSEHSLDNNRVYHRDNAKRIYWDRTLKTRDAKDVDGPLLTMTRTYVVQYADEINTGPYEDLDRQHHWLARSRVKNSNSDFKGHYYHEVEYPYAPANTVMVDPPVGPGTEDVGITRSYEGEIHKTLPEPSDARGVVTTTVPYDVNESINHCAASAAISGALYSSEDPNPSMMTHTSMSSIPW